MLVFAGNEKAADPVERLGCRPDFMVLVYLVITMGEKTRGGSQNSLFGPSLSAEPVDFLSNEKQVTAPLRRLSNPYSLRFPGDGPGKLILAVRPAWHSND